jgi:hypothetical protein
MVRENLYSEYWILAYEAIRQGWFEPADDYISDDPFFGFLLMENVSFYVQPTGSGVDYVKLEAAEY